MSLINIDIKTKEKHAVALLRSLGYSVIRPVSSKNKVSDSSLINYFYRQMTLTCGAVYSNNYSSNMSEDLNALKEAQVRIFKNTGLHKDIVNRDLQYLLEKLFNNYNQLNITSISSFSFLLSYKGNWILRKVATTYSSDYYDMVVQGLLDED